MRDEAVREAHRRITEESARVASGEVSHVDLVGCAVDAALDAAVEALRGKGDEAAALHEEDGWSIDAVNAATLYQAADLLTQGDETE